jgi:hypothetical protein
MHSGLEWVAQDHIPLTCGRQQSEKLVYENRSAILLTVAMNVSKGMSCRQASIFLWGTVVQLFAVTRVS